MSIWISKAAVVGALLLAAGCVAAGGAARVVQIGVEGPDGFAVAAPKGFCAAPEATSQIAGSDFVAFGRCPGAGGAPALLTATIGAPGSAGPDDPDAAALAAFFTAPEGRRVLSRVGRAESVTVHEVVAAEGAVLVRLTDLAGRAGDRDAWRAVVAVRARLVTLSVSGGAAAALAAPEGRRVMRAFIRAVRAAN